MKMEDLKYTIGGLMLAVDSYFYDDFIYFWKHDEEKDKITKACLSQWYPSTFIVDGVTYNCAEQYMMAEKARIFGYEEIRQQILAEYSQMAMKKLGRKVKNYDDAVWKSVRFDVVVKGNLAKFSQNEKLRNFLISTDDKVLVEASPKDEVWGIGLDEHSSEASSPWKWKGTNLLGFALMEVRDKLRKQE